MATTIGAGANDYVANLGGFTYTILDLTNPASGNDTLTSLSFYFVGDYTDAADVKCGTFFGSGLNWTNRDFETIGAVIRGSKQTFSGLSCIVQTGDILGIIRSSGQLESDNTTGSGRLISLGDKFDGVQYAYAYTANVKIGIEGYGPTAAIAGKKWQGITIGKWNGIIVSKINGV